MVVVTRLDRLGRSLAHVLRLLEVFHKHGVGFVSLNDADIDTTTPTGRLMLQIVGAFAEFERNLIISRTVAGVAAARARGAVVGRPRRELDLRAAHVLLNDGHSLREVAGMLGLPRATLARRLAEVRDGGPQPSLSEAA